MHQQQQQHLNFANTPKNTSNGEQQSYGEYKQLKINTLSIVIGKIYALFACFPLLAVARRCSLVQQLIWLKATESYKSYGKSTFFRVLVTKQVYNLLFFSLL